MASMAVMAGALLLMSALVSGQIPDTVIELDASNFEHDTQASTGQTTGHWFVLFNTRLEPHSRQAAKKIWNELAQDEDKEVIVAELIIDDDDNKAIARRFRDIQPPTAVLFRDRMMFVYPYSLAAEGALDKLREFAQGGYANVTPQVVPGTPPKPVIKPVVEPETNWIRAGLGALLLFGGIALHAAVILKRQKIEAQEKKNAAGVDALAPKPKAS